MTILQELAQSEPIRNLCSSVKKPGKAAALFGVHKIHRTVMAAAFALASERPVIFICDSDGDAYRAAEDMRALGLPEVEALPSREVTLLDVEGISHDEEIARLTALGKAARGQLKVVCCSVEALCLLTMPKEIYLTRGIVLEKGGEAEIRQLSAQLISAGYTRCDRVEGRGQYAQRGGILDVFPVDRDLPVRVEFFDTEIERISEFAIDTQRRTVDRTRCEIPPAREISLGENAVQRIEEFAKRIPDGQLALAVKRDLIELEEGILPVCTDRYLAACYDAPETILDYLPEAVLFLAEPKELEDRYRSLMERYTFDLESLAGNGMYHPVLGRFYADYSEAVSGRNRVLCDVFPRAVGDIPLETIVNLNSNAVPRWAGEVAVLKEDLQGYLYAGYRAVVLAGTDRGAKALCDDLISEGISAETAGEGFPAAGKVAVLKGTLSSGFEISPLKLVLITSSTETKQVRRPSQRPKKASEAFGSLEDLKVGDYVVHRNHGIGIFDGINRIDHHGFVADYIKIRYRDGDTLYVPVTGLDMVTPYISSKDDGKVTLDRLNSGEWQKTKQKVYRSVREMAKELIELYAKREKTEGILFSEDTDWQRDFELRFPYEETDDQLRSSDEIKKDMQSRKPMDRLLCGDVGVGKTEVALRAAFKAISDGYQVAFLVPTTILALQHYRTILERMEAYPIKVAMLSRFASPKEIKAGISGIRNGSVDIAVGTHRLLQKDVEFKKLGLLIVDEEQRFGVAHKEKLKEKFPNVDVLTLSATPIPRTLNMAMSGIRDMSVIENPPVDRHPVQTYVAEYDESTVRNAIRRELSRGGQVYYLHNRVETIDRTADKLRTMIPEARIEVAHGQMNEEALSEVWKKLVEGECDILVCTTIIETGVDVANCNTLIVEDADNLGLAQLYQIRGRVGRSSRRAYAWFLFRKDKILTEVSSKRLAAIRDFTSFGSGFKIAMRDLQIRGAGSVLSARQSGHIQNVGYDTYVRILEQAVRDEQGLPAPETEKECKIDLQISAYIPDSYIEDNENRIEMYKRIADITCKEDYDEVVEELRDRFGPLPEPVRLLCSVSSARANAARLGIYEIRQQRDSVLLYCDAFTSEQIKNAVSELPGRVYYAARGKKYLAIDLRTGEEPLESIFKILDVLRETAKQEKEKENT
ncbi:MAG: transcription-repair coupling factor [Oscillospiraceae bacterium]|nr:transcription-repair coupling factor [Oscillospiraceae bacterium]